MTYVTTFIDSKLSVAIDKIDVTRDWLAANADGRIFPHVFFFSLSGPFYGQFDLSSAPGALIDKLNAKFNPTITSPVPSPAPTAIAPVVEEVEEEYPYCPEEYARLIELVATIPADLLPQVLKKFKLPTFDQYMALATRADDYITHVVNTIVEKDDEYMMWSKIENYIEDLHSERIDQLIDIIDTFSPELLLSVAASVGCEPHLLADHLYDEHEGSYRSLVAKVKSFLD